MSPIPPRTPTDDAPQAFIDLTRPQAVQYWSAALGASEAVLREAVGVAGTKAEAVRQYLASGS